jgi:hypothetical protein
MRKSLLIAVVFMLALSPFAQNVDPLPAPEDVVLQLGTEGSVQFHLGELVPINFSYSAKVAGKYFWVGNGKLVQWKALEITCSPAAERVQDRQSLPERTTFWQMLSANCSGVGAGGGFAGGCFDCDGEVPLTTVALRFGVVPLNKYVRFRTPGTYTCQASSAEVTATSRSEKVRPALLVKSNPIVLTIVDDPGWAHAAATEYANSYDRFCRGEDVVEHRSLQCFDIAGRMTYLDTADSLAAEVNAFDGRNHGWENGFWDAIRQSSYPGEALRLMESRIQEPDFQVSTNILEWLASSELKMEVPDAFQSGTPAIHHAQAVEKLRKYVRLLGNSLSRKNSNVLTESAKTYRTFAEQEYCEGHSLISKKEQNQVLKTYR